MEESTAAKLARKLVQSFGNAGAIATLLDDDARWHLHVGPPEGNAMSGTHEGRKAIEALMEEVFGRIYDPAHVHTEIRSVLSDGYHAAVRFRLHARTTWGAVYSNDYALFADLRDGRIAEVWEYLDSLSASAQLAPGAPPASGSGVQRGRR